MQQRKLVQQNFINTNIMRLKISNFLLTFVVEHPVYFLNFKLLYLLSRRMSQFIASLFNFKIFHNIC